MMETGQAIVAPAGRLIAAAGLLDARQVSMRPDLDKLLAAWLRKTGENLKAEVSWDVPDCASCPMCSGHTGDWYCDRCGGGLLNTVHPDLCECWAEALAFADLLLEKP